MKQVLSPQALAEVCLVAKQVAAMPHDDDFGHADMVGAALDMVPGAARFEVEDAVIDYGFCQVLAYAEARVPRYVG